MPKQYKKGKSNRLTHKTSVWTLVAKSRFGAIEDLRSMKAKEKLLRSVETKPNIPKKIEPLVKESVDKKLNMMIYKLIRSNSSSSVNWN